MTVTKTIYSGVAVILLAGLIMGSVDVYSSVQANTKHREESKEDEMYEILIEIKTNQEFLIKRYDSEVNQ
ncbi:TMhelix containing protein [Vibrio phage 242E40-1]|nr:TMhelix containing protein [Vibrio phage 242E40-1]